MGDAVWVDQHPYMAQANSKEWLDGLTYIRKFKADRIVPGRGPVCGRDATERMSEYIRFMRARVRLNYRQGTTKQETVAERAARGRRLVSHLGRTQVEDRVADQAGDRSHLERDG